MIWPSSDERGVRSAVTLRGKPLEIALAFLSLLDPADKVIFMESEHDLLGEYAYLPDDQLVGVEVMYSDGFACARRMDGERKGTNRVM
jgi:hypothetical protein